VKPQSVLNYIQLNRAGLVRSLVQTALEASGYQIAALECPEMLAVRARLELSVLTGVGFDGLEEPPASMLLSAPKSDVADSPPPAAEPPSPATSEADEDSEEEPVVEIEERQPSPPLRKRR